MFITTQYKCIDDYIQYFKYTYLSASHGGQFLLEYVDFQRQHSSSITINKNVFTNILFH